MVAREILADVTIIAVPNVSEGRDESKVSGLASCVETAGARVLDIHSDAVHNRSVFTVAATEASMVQAMTDLAAATRYIDLRKHSGVHPRIGGLDVCPVVAHEIGIDRAARLARRIARAIGAEAGLPVYLYGAAAARDETRDLPALRRGGLQGALDRAARGLIPDYGPPQIDERHGVVCVGARSVLIAFNVWLRCDAATARRIAAAVRSRAGGPPGVRALGLPMGQDTAQVSMNLTDPSTTGIDTVFEVVEGAARAAGVSVIATEVVGLVPERYSPDPHKKAARLLMKPGPSLETALSVLR